jgi:hypothetical protein
MTLSDFFFNDTNTMLICLGAGIILSGIGFLFGQNSKKRKLMSQIRHLERERNDLHVQCVSLNEIVDNQELDIRRYAAELQLFVEMQSSWIEERTQLGIQLDQAKPGANMSLESTQLLNKILKEDLLRSQKTIESLNAKLMATEQILDYMRDRQETA